MHDPISAFSSLWTLAQADPSGAAVAPGTPTGQAAPGQLVPGGAAQGVPAQNQPPPASPFGGMFFMLLLGGMLVFMIVTSVLGQRRERRRREELISSIKKQDKVQTIGGIIGTVAEIRDDEIVLRVDENANTRIRFAKSAVQQVLRSSEVPEVAAAKA